MCIIKDTWSSYLNTRNLHYQFVSRKKPTILSGHYPCSTPLYPQDIPLKTISGKKVWNFGTPLAATEYLQYIQRSHFCR
jgi:hypothetical protein